MNPETLLLNQIEYEEQLLRIRHLQPCLDVLRDAERMEHSATIRRDPQ
jgi:hypothetical protein